MDSPKTYRKRPVTIEAIQWTGENIKAVEAFVGRAVMPYGTFNVETAGFRMNSGADTPDGWTAELWVAANKQWLPMETGEWVAKDKHGCYPIKADVFAETYDEEPED